MLRLQDKEQRPEGRNLGAGAKIFTQGGNGKGGVDLMAILNELNDDDGNDTRGAKASPAPIPDAKAGAPFQQRKGKGHRRSSSFGRTSSETSSQTSIVSFGGDRCWIVEDGTARRMPSVGGSCRNLRAAGGDSNGEADAFPLDLSLRRTVRPVEGVSLRRWTRRAAAAAAGEGGAARYAELALPVALRLTEAIVEAEGRGGFPPPVPLASIAAECIYVRTKEGGDRRLQRGGGRDRDGAIDHTVSFKGGGEGGVLDPGNAASRLSALGVVLYELFSREEPDFGEDVPDSLSLNSLSLESENSNDDGPGSNSRRWSGTQLTDDVHSRCVAGMDGRGIPEPICALVKKLLDRGREGHCETGAFASFAEVLADMRLIIKRTPRASSTTW